MAPSHEKDWLLQQLSSRDAECVIEAMSGLKANPDSRAIPVLLELLRSTSDARIRNETALVLRDLKVEQAKPIILYLLQQPATEGSRGSLLHALEPFDCAEDVDVLINLVLSGGCEVRHVATMVIESIEGPIPEELRVGCVKRLQKYIRNEEDRLYLIHEILAKLQLSGVPVASDDSSDS